jgi:hypothetical protein
MNFQPVGCRWASRRVVTCAGDVAVLFVSLIRARPGVLRHAAGLMLGMVSGLDRKNCWVRHGALSDRVEVRDLTPLGRRSGLVKLGAA